jgi:hypothetical protein
LVASTHAQQAEITPPKSQSVVAVENVCAWPNLTLMPDGTVDPTFNPNGSGPGNAVEDMILMPDGRILIAGNFLTYNGSSAYIALALHLAFWTGKNMERIKNIMLRSALVRDKWDREKYLQDTIKNACAMSTDVYSINYQAGSQQVQPPITAVAWNPAPPAGQAALPAPAAAPSTAIATTGGANHLERNS